MSNNAGYVTQSEMDKKLEVLVMASAAPVSQVQEEQKIGVEDANLTTAWS